LNAAFFSGRLTADPKTSYGSGDSKTVTRFSLAIDRGKDKQGNSLGVDYPSFVAFGKTAEIIEQYLAKGSQVNVVSHVRTGSYEKDGKKIFTTDFIVDRIEFTGLKPNPEAKQDRADAKAVNDAISTMEETPSGFEKLDDDIDPIPF